MAIQRANFTGQTALAPPPLTDFDSAPALVYAGALFIMGSLSTLITPALLESWAGQYHWAEARLGWIAMVELAGLGIGSGSAFFWQRRYRWRPISGGAIVLIIAANAACAFSATFGVLCWLRLASGIGGGMLIGVFTAYLSNTRAPERFLAVTTLVQILTQAAVTVVSSQVTLRSGMNGMYAMLGMAVAILLPAIRLLPEGWPRDADIPPIGDAPGAGISRSWVGGGLVLAAFAPFEIFQGGTAAFLQEFGQRGAALAAAPTLHVIGLAAVGSGLGPIAAFFLADRLGVLIPLAGSIAVMLLSILLLAQSPYSALSLLLLLSVLQATWLFATCYFYAALIKMNNVLTQAASPLSSVCLAAGASLMGLAIESHGLAGIVQVSVICLIFAGAAALPPLYRVERRERRARA